MKTLIIFVISLTIFSCSQTTVKKYTIEQFHKNTNIWGGYFSPDETKLLVTNNETGIYNVFAIPVDGKAPEQLTFSEKESYFAISYVPDGNGFLYYADKGGDENDHLYWVDKDRKTLDLTPFENSKSGFFKWSHDEKSFFYISNKRNPKFFDLYEKQIIDFADPNANTLIYQNDKGFDVSAISSDKRYLALTKSITTSNNELYLYDMQTKETKHISEHEGDAVYEAQFFDLANENLYLLSNENSEFTYLVKYNIKSGNKEKIYETNWDVWYAKTSFNEKYRVIGVNEDAKTAISLTDLSSNNQVELPVIKGSSISSVSIGKSEKLMRLTVSSSVTTNDIYFYNIETKELKRLTKTLNPDINTSDLVNAEVIRFKSYDGTEVPCIFYKPHHASKSNKVPALVWVHGGPGGQTRLNYSALIQYLVNQGYAILAINNRGSSGYGKTFYKMDDLKHGEADLKDCVSSKDFLAETGFIDMEKVGIMGGSYGGYMVMAALAFTPEEFDVGVNIFGVTNWLRTLKSIPPHWESFREALYAELGDPFSDDSTRLYKISPLFHAKNVTKPLIVLQGANDVRVLQIESDEIVAAVESNNVPVEYIIFEDEGHGFLKTENKIEGHKKIRLFLDKYLKRVKS
ncbi:MAG: S9 family peptidase [Calditrichaeota bacterium]|nr:MAG: S9 family peptidase [Calditrichota bacterium]MBL1208138.1 S9 family peptidase [Calditrichota bacterium]NOG47976.1 S9 family peptidase [Calditrichota bacterium]